MVENGCQLIGGLPCPGTENRPCNLLKQFLAQSLKGGYIQPDAQQLLGPFWVRQDWNVFVERYQNLIERECRFSQRLSLAIISITQSKIDNGELFDVELPTFVQVSMGLCENNPQVAGEQLLLP